MPNDRQVNNGNALMPLIDPVLLATQALNQSKTPETRDKVEHPAKEQAQQRQLSAATTAYLQNVLARGARNEEPSNPISDGLNQTISALNDLKSGVQLDTLSALDQKDPTIIPQVQALLGDRVSLEDMLGRTDTVADRFGQRSKFDQILTAAGSLMGVMGPLISAANPRLGAAITASGRNLFSIGDQERKQREAFTSDVFKRLLESDIQTNQDLFRAGIGEVLGQRKESRQEGRDKTARVFGLAANLAEISSKGEVSIESIRAETELQKELEDKKVAAATARQIREHEFQNAKDKAFIAHEMNKLSSRNDFEKEESKLQRRHEDLMQRNRALEESEQKFVDTDPDRYEDTFNAIMSQAVESIFDDTGPISLAEFHVLAGRIALQLGSGNDVEDITFGTNGDRKFTVSGQGLKPHSDIIFKVKTELINQFLKSGRVTEKSQGERSLFDALPRDFPGGAFSSIKNSGGEFGPRPLFNPVF